MRIIIVIVFLISSALVKSHNDELEKHGSDGLISKLDNHIYGSVVGMDQFVWLIKIGSKMCQGCKEFYPEFKKLSETFTYVKYGVVYVEDELGMKLIKKFKGVMNKGLPAVLLIREQDPYKFEQLVFGQTVKAEELKKILIPRVKELKFTTGLYKRNPGEYADHGFDKEDL